MGCIRNNPARRQNVLLSELSEVKATENEVMINQFETCLKCNQLNRHITIAFCSLTKTKVKESVLNSTIECPENKF